jgi:hypothetical protein
MVSSQLKRAFCWSTYHSGLLELTASLIETVRNVANRVDRLGRVDI